ncbi:MAG: hypothetical protein ACRD1S_03160, partial [Vicinamibacterales bacterium]
VREFSLAAPLEAKAALTATPGSRDLSITALSDLVSIEAVEYPVGQYPPSYARYSVWLTTLTLSPPAGVASISSVSVLTHTENRTYEGG